jgi:hypothetical protein
MPENVIVHLNRYAVEMFYEGHHSWSMIIHDDSQNEIIDETVILGACEYPECYEPATLACHMIGCNHRVCETHGNCIYELTSDHHVEICWLCCGKGWEEDDREPIAPGDYRYYDIRTANVGCVNERGDG